jgi:hypothetical protein
MPTRETVYKYNPEAIKIGPARIFIADFDTTEPPTQISDVVNLATYNAATGWTSLGDTIEAVTMTHGWDAIPVRTQQHGRVADYVGDYNIRVATTLAERTKDVKEAVAGVDLTTKTNAAAETVTYYTVTKQMGDRRLAVLHLDETAPTPFKLIMTVFPKVRRSGSDSAIAWDRDNPQGFPVEWNVYPDEAIQDPETGEYVYAYDIEQ